ncbi:integrase core domain-containing protein [Streptomyces sp. NPDC005151]
MILSTVYAVTRRLLSLPVLLLRRDVSKEAELLVLRHENAVLRRQVPRVRYEPADRLWFAALSHGIPRRRWVQVFRTLTSYLEHYNGQRPHRALRQLCPSQAEAGPPRPIDIAEHRVHRRAVLGGLINEYQISS